MGEKILERVMAESAPTSLSDEELELDVQPLTKPPRVMPVTAWVRYGNGETAVRVEGQALAWMRRAVTEEWQTPEGEVHRFGS